MSRLVDLDDAVGLQRAFDELQRAHDLHKIDPELRADIERTIDEGVVAGRLANEDAARMRSELDEVAPAAMLAANVKTLIENKPTIGYYRRAFPTRSSAEISDISGWLAADPSRIVGIVVEAARFSSDWLKIAEHATQLADAAGIDADAADRIIVDAIRSVRKVGSSNVG